MTNYHSECLICKSKNLKPLKGYERHDLVQCRACNFIFIKRIPTTEELNAYYKNYATAHYLSPITVLRYNELLDEFEKYRKTNKILDVGCGIGHFLSVAKKRGWEVYGTEYSEGAIKIAQHKGITMHHGVLDARNYEAESFDIVTSFEVIEHINNPLEEMANIRQLVRKDGLFYCTTPNFNSLMRYYLKADFNIICYPEHLSYYTPKTLTNLVEKFGFKKDKILTTGVSLTRLYGSQEAKKQREQPAKDIKKTTPDSVPTEGEAMVREGSPDEILRTKMETNKFWGLAKKLANGFFNITQTGHALKAYYIKK